MPLESTREVCVGGIVTPFVVVFCDDSLLRGKSSSSSASSPHLFSAGGAILDDVDICYSYI